jgi:serine/threonine-protein kinase
MDRADAERVFALVAEIGGDLRGRIVSERWWLVWLAIGVDMLALSAALQTLVWLGENRIPLLAALIAANVLILACVIRFIRRRGGGHRTAIERYLWWIWTAHLCCALAVLLLETLMGLPLFSMAPVLALVGAFAFSNTAMLTERFFLLNAALFLGVAVTMGMFRHSQLLIYGSAWFVAGVSVSLHYRISYKPCATRRI